MRLRRNSSRTSLDNYWDCKIKRVYPRLPLRVHSAGNKGLTRNWPGNPETAPGTAEGCASASEWSAENLSERLRSELSPRAWNHLVRAAAGHGTSVEQLLRLSLSEIG
jgi:hypothetical protein